MLLVGALWPVPLLPASGDRGDGMPASGPLQGHSATSQSSDSPLSAVAAAVAAAAAGAVVAAAVAAALLSPC